ncbi:MAG: FtsQ-type POTRA domain-containing protein [Treponema sp.]|uniref:cell division protein FtsQ/DivIB n=1 Tax=Treponema sp. TaxID=166 RepID=UPI001B54737A|nr:FtsQ-type POTRA domain-containing protein [Treponema sp.]MBP5402394.1 FtsQ-type POTRA domain-containing protein [Treponema sp.]MBR5934161.1 FtsQ-type POTRA domain-containing protein [Treponema sp.]
MSDLSLLAEFDRYEVSKKYKEEKDAKFIKWIKVLIVALGAVFLAELAIYKFINPSLNAVKIVVSGNSNYAVNDISAALSDLYGQNYFGFDCATAASRLSSLAGIESVNIEKSFPDKIKISVVERQSVAMIFIEEDGSTIPIQIDKNGVLFKNINSEIVEDGSIPIVSGIPVEHFTSGMRIPVKYRGLIDQISKIQSLPQKYFAAVSEICVVPKTYGNYELMLIPVNSHIRVYTGRVLNEESLQYMMVVLDVVNSMEQNVSQIDLRYDSISYR